MPLLHGRVQAKIGRPLLGTMIHAFRRYFERCYTDNATDGRADNRAFSRCMTLHPNDAHSLDPECCLPFHMPFSRFTSNGDKATYQAATLVKRATAPHCGAFHYPTYGAFTTLQASLTPALGPSVSPGPPFRNGRSMAPTPASRTMPSVNFFLTLLLHHEPQLFYTPTGTASCNAMARINLGGSSSAVHPIQIQCPSLPCLAFVHVPFSALCTPRNGSRPLHCRAMADRSLHQSSIVS